MKKLFIALLLCLAVSAGNTLILEWDLNDPKEEVTGYNTYELVGTNWNKIVSVGNTNRSVITNVIAGLHTYAVTATNMWGESERSIPVSTASTVTSVKTLKIKAIVTVLIE